jgi:hypothetical protein
VVTPVTKRVKVVRCVVSIIVAVPIALLDVSKCPDITGTTIDILARQ